MLHTMYYTREEGENMTIFLRLNDDDTMLFKKYKRLEIHTLYAPLVA